MSLEIKGAGHNPIQEQITGSDLNPNETISGIGHEEIDQVLNSLGDRFLAINGYRPVSGLPVLIDKKPYQLSTTIWEQARKHGIYSPIAAHTIILLPDDAHGIFLGKTADYLMPGSQLNRPFLNFLTQTRFHRREDFIYRFCRMKIFPMENNIAQVLAKTKVMPDCPALEDFVFFKQLGNEWSTIRQLLSIYFD
jgi:hypothetical protein